jgi:hypothetical protein
VQALAEQEAPERRSVVPVAAQHEGQDRGPARRNVGRALAEHEAQEQRSVVPAVAQHEEQEGGPARRNARRAAAEHEAQERRSVVPGVVQHGQQALGPHEGQELLGGEDRRPSVCQAVPIRSIPRRIARGLRHPLLLRLWT